ncbi:hypothetical protein [Saccharothrix lopnurensis]|uniref:Uncharacterized protein n=1 Tax=Saccharothrix lopnurensis TaxID=1670621 RepID=A0ABW1P1Z0_9PSEU
MTMPEARAWWLSELVALRRRLGLHEEPEGAELGAVMAEAQHAATDLMQQLGEFAMLARAAAGAGRHFGRVSPAEGGDGTWSAHCWLCCTTSVGWPAESAAWVELDRHWHTCRPVPPTPEPVVEPGARVGWRIGRDVLMTGEVDQVVGGWAYVVADGSTIRATWGLPVDRLTVITPAPRPAGAPWTRPLLSELLHQAAEHRATAAAEGGDRRG